MMNMPMYVAAGFAALVLAAAVAYTFLRPGAAPTLGTWGGAGGLFSLGQPSGLEARNGQGYQGEGVESLGIIPLPQGSVPSEEFASDIAELLAQLTQPQATSSESEPITPSAYSFIPQGLISIESEKPLTPEQQALREYGNAVGLSLAAFADLHPNMPQVLKDQAEDRADPSKVAALKRLASDFTRLGDELAATDPIPPAAVSAHEALVAAYRDAGEKLARIPDAQADEAFLAAVNAYNPSAENLSARLVALVDLFSARGVRFSSSDPGAIFTFNANASL